jgi:K+-transporting ATPase, A chain
MGISTNRNHHVVFLFVVFVVFLSTTKGKRTTTITTATTDTAASSCCFQFSIPLLTLNHPPRLDVTHLQTLRINSLDRIQNTHFFAIHNKAVLRRRRTCSNIPPLELRANVVKNSSEHPNIDMRQDQQVEQKVLAVDNHATTTTTTAAATTTDNSSSSSHEQLQVWQARMLILLAACLYGTNFTCVKILGENLPLQVGIAMRFSVAAMATLPWLFKTTTTTTGTLKNANVDSFTSFGEKAKDQSEEKSFKVWKDMRIPYEMAAGPVMGGAEVGFWNTLGFIGQAMGLQTSPASTSAFICSLAVVTVPLYDFLSGKKISSRSILGAILAVMGVALLEVGDGILEGGMSVVDGVDSGRDGFLMPSTGTLYSLIQPVAFGMGFWRLEYWTRKFTGPDDGLKLTAAHMMTIASLMVVSSVLMFHANGDIVYNVQEWMRNPTVLGAILWTGIVTTAIPSF